MADLLMSFLRIQEWIALGLPEHIKVESILGVGHPAERKCSAVADSLAFDKIRHNGWAESGRTCTPV